MNRSDRLAIGFLIGICLFTIVSLAFAADPKPAAPVDPHPVPEAIKTRALILFQRYLIHQNKVITMQQQICESVPGCKSELEKANAAANDYNSALPQLTKDAGLPTGSSFDIDIDKSTVTPRLPVVTATIPPTEPKEDKKADEAAPKQ